MKIENEKIILASASPRRRELLKEIVDDFSVVSSDVKEVAKSKDPEKTVEELALLKASSLDSDGLIIAADTLVFDGKKPLGKPKNDDDAFDMLTELSDKVHCVYTGVCLKYNDETIVFHDKTDVEFRRLSPEEIRFYISKYNPSDKAGAYGIQDGYCVKRISGSYSNVMGLPVEKLREKLKEIGVKVKE